MARLWHRRQKRTREYAIVMIMREYRGIADSKIRAESCREPSKLFTR